MNKQEYEEMRADIGWQNEMEGHSKDTYYLMEIFNIIANDIDFDDLTENEKAIVRVLYYNYYSEYKRGGRTWMNL